MDMDSLLDLYNNEQMTGDISQQLLSIIENRLKHVHTALPAVIKSYDPNKNTAIVQPGVKRIWVSPTATKAVALPVVPDVPVIFPSGGGYTMTFPVAAGDECLLVFLERAMDYWYKSGGVQLPSNFRMHHLSDAVAFVGLRSQAQKLSNIQMDGVEIRNADRSIYIKLKSSGIEIKGDVTLTGTLTASVDVKANGISLHDHLHSGVTSGGSNTGPAV
jgi:hypothetical protein